MQKKTWYFERGVGAICANTIFCRVTSFKSYCLTIMAFYFRMPTVAI
jgi:hypothetical protein